MPETAAEAAPVTDLMAALRVSLEVAPGHKGGGTDKEDDVREADEAGESGEAGGSSTHTTSRASRRGSENDQTSRRSAARTRDAAPSAGKARATAEEGRRVSRRGAPRVSWAGARR
jgi:hypothetical protein